MRVREYERERGEGERRRWAERERVDVRIRERGRGTESFGGRANIFDRSDGHREGWKEAKRRQKWVPINIQSDRGRFPRNRGRNEEIRGPHKAQVEFQPPPPHDHDRVFPRLPSLPARASNHHYEKGDGSNPQRQDQEGEASRAKLFSDLFSEKEEKKEEGWVEVRRRRQRSSKLPPLIINPCFFCGLPGHRKRFCPKKINMICYGCNQAGHRLSECPAVERVPEMNFELEDVEEIGRITSHLAKFAIYQPLHGNPTPEELKMALKKFIDKEEWYEWEGSITSMAQGRFLVSFNNEFRANNLAKKGMIDFGNFTGRFHLWSENMGAEKIYKPVSVWIDIKGLPLHCWVPELIKQMVGKFGIFRKMTNNVYDKSTADVIKALVEVEDLSLIPKTMHCSYKSLSDDRIRSYAVHIEPKGKSLPMSEIDRQKWELTLAASGRTSEVADWRDDDLITTARNVAGAATGVGRGIEDDAELEELNAAGGMEATNAGVQEGAGEEEGEGVKEGAGDMEEAGVKEVIAAAEVGSPNSNSNLNLFEGNTGGPSNSERAARAKGKRPMVEGVNIEKLKNRLLRPFSNSGSDSFDPDMEMGQMQGGPTGSEDISATGPKSTSIMKNSKEDPSKEQKEDEDREGEEEDSEEVDSVRALQAKAKGKGKEVRMQSKKGEQDPKERGRTLIKKRQPLPFGVAQKGAFGFGKRPRSTSSSSKSASKSGTFNLPRAKPRPIAALHDDFIAEVSRNVGLKKPLSKSQIEDLKALERDRSSH